MWDKFFVIGPGCKERYFFRARRKKDGCCLASCAKISKRAEMPRRYRGGCRSLCVWKHARAYYAYDRAILSCRGSSKFSPCDSVFASVLGRICNSDAGEMPAEARKALILNWCSAPVSRHLTILPGCLCTQDPWILFSLAVRGRLK